MNDAINRLLGEWCNGLYEGSLRCLRHTRYVVLAIAIALTCGGIYTAPSSPIGWLAMIGGMTLAGFNLGTWKLVGRFTAPTSRDE